VLSSATEQSPDPRRRRPVDEVIVLRRQGRLPLDDTLEPDDPILRPRRRGRRRSPVLYVHREPVPHQPALALALSAVAVGCYLAWGWTELAEGASDFPLGLGRDRRAAEPVIGVTAASFAVSALLAATVGRRPGRSPALRWTAIVCAAVTTIVVVATLVAAVPSVVGT